MRKLGFETLIIADTIVARVPLEVAVVIQNWNIIYYSILIYLSRFKFII